MTTIDLPAGTHRHRAELRRPRAESTTPAPTAVVADPSTGRRPSGLQRTVNLLGTLLVVLAVAAVLFLAVGPRFLGYQTATMLTASMAPEIIPGDVVVTTAQPVSDVEVGDVISYHIPVEDHRVETHRVTEVVRGEDGVTSVKTKGDANESVDPWTATLDGDHVYEVKAVIPVIGDVIRLLRTPVLSQILVYGAPVVLVGGLLVMIWSRPRNDDEAPTPDRGSLLPARDRTTMAELPTLDRSVLDALGEELRSEAAALQFAGTFVEMLPQRIRTVEAAFSNGDIDAAVVALLSLTVSSAMVGAPRLEQASSTALDQAGDTSRHAALVADLRVCGAELQSVLGGIIR